MDSGLNEPERMVDTPDDSGVVEMVAAMGGVFGIMQHALSNASVGLSRRHDKKEATRQKDNMLAALTDKTTLV